MLVLDVWYSRRYEMTVTFVCLFALLAASGNPENPQSAAVVMQSLESHDAIGSEWNGNLSTVGGEDEYPGFGSKSTIIELNTWVVPAGAHALGLDYIDFWYVDNVVAYASASDDMIYWMDADDGAAVGNSWATDGNNTSPFGVVHVPIPSDDEIHVNDFSYDGVFYREWDTSWIEYNALCDNMGRGMDYNEAEDKIFELYTSGSSGSYNHYVAMYTPGTSTGSTYNLDVLSVDWFGSGVALFPNWEGGVDIAVTLYDSGWIRFFEYPGNPGGVYYDYGVLPYSASMTSIWDGFIQWVYGLTPGIPVGIRPNIRFSA